MELYYLNTDLKDLDGEIWKDVPIKHLWGQYEVSNKGRIKSLERMAIRKNGSPHPIKTRILSQGKRVRKKKNGQIYIGLFVNMPSYIKGKYRTYTVESLVLNAFKSPDKFNDYTHHINGISYDNRLENLTFEDLHTKRKIEYDIGVRDKKIFKKILIPATDTRSKAKPFTREYYNKNKEEIRSRLKESTKNGFEKRGKHKYPVTVFILNNKEIFTYSSIRNASEQLGLKEYIIRNALDKPHKYKYIQVKKGVFNLEQFNPRGV